MDTRKVETRALSDDQLDAVSGGDKAAELAKQNAQQAAEAKKEWETLKGFQQALQELP